MWVIVEWAILFLFVAHGIMSHLITDGILDLLKYGDINYFENGPSYLRGQVTCPGDSGCKL